MQQFPTMIVTRRIKESDSLARNRGPLVTMEFCEGRVEGQCEYAQSRMDDASYIDFYWTDRERTDVLMRAESSDLRSHGDGRVGDGGHPT